MSQVALYTVVAQGATNPQAPSSRDCCSRGDSSGTSIILCLGLEIQNPLQSTISSEFVQAYKKPNGELEDSVDRTPSLGSTYRVYANNADIGRMT